MNYIYIIKKKTNEKTIDNDGIRIDGCGCTGTDATKVRT